MPGADSGVLRVGDDETLSDEDRALFRERAGAVRPLRERGTAAPRRRSQRRLAPAQSRPASPAAADEPHAGTAEPPGGAGDVQHFARPGLQQKILRRLRRGQIAAEAEVDLHGMTAREAERALHEFLAHAAERGLRCVRVIHGKGRSSRSGQAVIKWRVDGWLRARAEVLAFCSAPPARGGTGALHVLLRR